MLRKLVITLFLISAVNSQSFSSLRGGEVLFLNPSVKSAGMQNSYVSNTTNDAFSFFCNPAHSSQIPLIGIMYNTAFQSGDNFSEFAYGAFSFSYPELFFGINLGIGAVSTIYANIEQDHDIAAYLNLSRKFGVLGVGTNIKYIYSKFFMDNKSSPVTADIGVLADLGLISFGVSGFNIAGDFYDINDEKIEPSIAAGMSLNLKYYNKFFLVISIEGLQQDINKMEAVPKAGIELTYSYFSLRGGYEYRERFDKKDKYTVGAGIHAKNFILDYAYTPDNNAFDYHKMALSYKLKRYAVKNEQFQQQVKLEKKESKVNIKNRLKDAKAKVKEEKEFEKKQSILAKKLKKNEKGILPMQIVKYDNHEEEFSAVLSPVEEDLLNTSKGKTEKNFNPKIYLEGVNKSKEKEEKMKSVKKSNNHEQQRKKEEYDAVVEVLKAEKAAKENNKKPDLRIVQKDDKKKINQAKKENDIKMTTAKDSKQKNKK